MKRILGIIPARYHSTRFPAKALADIGGKTMIERVYEQVCKSSYLYDVVVATDHEAIARAVRNFGGNVVMTSPKHPSGTDRCQEALSKQHDLFDYVINIQGDEPFIAPQQIDILAALLDGHTELATLAKKIESSDELFDPNVVKVVFEKNGEALLFSRAAIPHLRNINEELWLNRHHFYKHIGIYAYRVDILHEITSLPISPLEKAEALEQLRWLENSYPINVAETPFQSIGIDTPEDLKKVSHLY